MAGWSGRPPDPIDKGLWGIRHRITAPCDVPVRSHQNQRIFVKFSNLGFIYRCDGQGCAATIYDGGKGRCS